MTTTESPLEHLQARVEAMMALDAIRWSADAIRRTSIFVESPKVVRAVSFVDRWLRAPDEGGRLAALQEAEALNYEGVAGWLFASIAWSSGSMVDPRVSIVDAPPGLSARAAAAALLTALGEETDDTHREATVANLLAKSA